MGSHDKDFVWNDGIEEKVIYLLDMYSCLVTSQQRLLKALLFRWTQDMFYF